MRATGESRLKGDLQPRLAAPLLSSYLLASVYRHGTCGSSCLEERETPPVEPQLRFCSFGKRTGRIDSTARAGGSLS